MNSNSTKIDLNIGDKLTSISCGHIVVDVLKFISYQRLQIPYTYQWLKQVVNTRKSSKEWANKNESLMSERHFRIASSAVENLDFLIKSLLQEIKSPSMPEEVCIVIGATPMTCREVYRILLPSVCHSPQCHSVHIANDQKLKHHVLKALAMSDKLSQILAPTNTYVFIKKKSSSSPDSLPVCDSFILASGCRIPKNSKIVVIDFRTRCKENVACCNDIKVFSDEICQDIEDLQINELSDDNDDIEFREIESTDTIKWYQSCYIMKGFKDYVVNGISVTNSWLEC